MKEMYKGMVNSPQTKLSKAINSADTDIYVKDGLAFPKGPNLAVIGTDKSAETILYSSVNNDILVGCTRGYQGEAKTWDVNTPIARNFTEADLDAVQENIKSLDENKVSKENGKQLSTNDYTTEAKAKVDAIPADPKYTDTIQDLSGYVKKSDVFDRLTYNGNEEELSNIPFSAQQGVFLWGRLSQIAPGGFIDPDKIVPKISIQDREPIQDSELQGILLSGALNELFLRTTKLNERKADKSAIKDVSRFKTKGEISDLKYSTLKNLKPGFYNVNNIDIISDGKTLATSVFVNSLYLLPQITGSLFVGVEYIPPAHYPFIYMCASTSNDELYWYKVASGFDINNIKSKLPKVATIDNLTFTKIDNLVTVTGYVQGSYSNGQLVSAMPYAAKEEMTVAAYPSDDPIPFYLKVIDSEIKYIGQKSVNERLSLNFAFVTKS
ncbi:hypothetical protein [Peptoniphilus sp. EMRHCC_23]|uniref:hypothetical protein n=1 Tax=Peptoniphilus rachelemmaiella TaxID=2811779 RepID=UPI001C000C91|nr:hypothetical protein [Peptoniphilus rachelemmaiella]